MQEDKTEEVFDFKYYKSKLDLTGNDALDIYDAKDLVKSIISNLQLTQQERYELLAQYFHKFQRLQISLDVSRLELVFDDFFGVLSDGPQDQANKNLLVINSDVHVLSDNTLDNIVPLMEALKGFYYTNSGWFKTNINNDKAEVLYQTMLFQAYNNKQNLFDILKKYFTDLKVDAEIVKELVYKHLQKKSKFTDHVVLGGIIYFLMNNKNINNEEKKEIFKVLDYYDQEFKQRLTDFLSQAIINSSVNSEFSDVFPDGAQDMYTKVFGESFKENIVSKIKANLRSKINKNEPSKPPETKSDISLQDTFFQNIQEDTLKSQPEQSINVKLIDNTNAVNNLIISLFESDLSQDNINLFKNSLQSIKTDHSVKITLLPATQEAIKTKMLSLNLNVEEFLALKANIGRVKSDLSAYKDIINEIENILSKILFEKINIQLEKALTFAKVKELEIYLQNNSTFKLIDNSFSQLDDLIKLAKDRIEDNYTRRGTNLMLFENTEYFNKIMVKIQEFKFDDITEKNMDDLQEQLNLSFNGCRKKTARHFMQYYHRDKEVSITSIVEVENVFDQVEYALEITKQEARDAIYQTAEAELENTPKTTSSRLTAQYILELKTIVDEQVEEIKECEKEGLNIGNQLIEVIDDVFEKIKQTKTNIAQEFNNNSDINRLIDIVVEKFEAFAINIYNEKCSSFNQKLLYLKNQEVMNIDIEALNLERKTLLSMKQKIESISISKEKNILQEPGDLTEVTNKAEILDKLAKNKEKIISSIELLKYNLNQSNIDSLTSLLSPVAVPENTDKLATIVNELNAIKQEAQKIITFYNTIKTKVKACENQDLDLTIPEILNLEKDIIQPTVDENHQGIIDNINTLWQEAKTTALNKASTKLAEHVASWLFENRLDRANLALRDIESVISTKDIKQYFLENHFSEIKDKEIQNSKVDGLINESKIDEYKNTITSNQKFKDELVIQFGEIKQNKLTNMQKYLAYVEAVKLHNEEIATANKYIEKFSSSDITAVEDAPTLTSLAENNPIVNRVASARENAQAFIGFKQTIENKRSNLSSIQNSLNQADNVTDLDKIKSDAKKLLEAVNGINFDNIIKETHTSAATIIKQNLIDDLNKLNKNIKEKLELYKTKDLIVKRIKLLEESPDKLQENINSLEKSLEKVPAKTDDSIKIVKELNLIKSKAESIIKFYNEIQTNIEQYRDPDLTVNKILDLKNGITKPKITGYETAINNIDNLWRLAEQEALNKRFDKLKEEISGKITNLEKASVPVIADFESSIKDKLKELEVVGFSKTFDQQGQLIALKVKIKKAKQNAQEKVTSAESQALVKKKESAIAKAEQDFKSIKSTDITEWISEIDEKLKTDFDSDNSEVKAAYREKIIELASIKLSKHVADWLVESRLKKAKGALVSIENYLPEGTEGIKTYFVSNYFAEIADKNNININDLIIEFKREHSISLTPQTEDSIIDRQQFKAKFSEQLESIEQTKLTSANEEYSEYVLAVKSRNVEINLQIELTEKINNVAKAIDNLLETDGLSQENINNLSTLAEAKEQYETKSTLLAINNLVENLKLAQSNAKEIVNFYKNTQEYIAKISNINVDLAIVNKVPTGPKFTDSTNTASKVVVKISAPIEPTKNSVVKYIEFKNNIQKITSDLTSIQTRFDAASDVKALNDIKTEANHLLVELNTGTFSGVTITAQNNELNRLKTGSIDNINNFISAIKSKKITLINSIREDKSLTEYTKYYKIAENIAGESEIFIDFTYNNIFRLAGINDFSNKDIIGDDIILVTKEQPENHQKNNALLDALKQLYVSGKWWGDSQSTDPTVISNILIQILSHHSVNDSNITNIINNFAKNPMYTEEVLKVALDTKGLSENVKNNIIKIRINLELDKFNQKIADFNTEIAAQQDSIEKTIYLKNLQKINMDIKSLHGNLESDFTVLQALFDELKLNKAEFKSVMPTLNSFNSKLMAKQNKILSRLIDAKNNKFLTNVCSSEDHAICKLSDNLKNNDFVDSNIDSLDKIININATIDAEILRRFLVIVGDKSKDGYSQMKIAQSALYRQNGIDGEGFYKNYIDSLLSNRIENLYTEIDEVAGKIFKDKHNGSNVINLLRDAQSTFFTFFNRNTLKGLTEDLINQKINESKTLNLLELQDSGKKSALRQQIANDYEKLLLKQLGKNIATELFGEKDNNEAVFNQLVTEETDENILEYLRSKIIKDPKISSCYEKIAFTKSFELKARSLLEEYKTKNSANLSEGKTISKLRKQTNSINDTITQLVTNLNQENIKSLKNLLISIPEHVATGSPQEITTLVDNLNSIKQEAMAVINYYDNYLINIAKISNPNIINININNLQTPLVKNENLQQVLENLSNNWEKTKDSVLKYIKFTNDIAKAKLELATIKNNINTATSIQELNNIKSQVSNYKLAENASFIVEAHKIEAERLQTELSKQISEIKLDLTKATETQKTSGALAEFKSLVQEKLNLLQSTTELKLEQVKTLKSEITKAKDTLLSNHPAAAQTEANFHSFNELINLAGQIIIYGDAVISRRKQIDEKINLFLNSDPPRSSKDLEDKIKLPELTPPKNVQSTLNLFENKQLSESLARGNNILNFYNKAQEIIQEITKENYKFNEKTILSELNNLYQKLSLEDQRTKLGSIKQEAQSIVDFYDIAEEYIAYTKQADINEQSINARDEYFVASRPIVVAVPVTPGIDQVLKIAASAKKTALEYVKLKSKLEQNIKELQPDSNYAYSRINSEDYTKQESVDSLSEAQRSNIETLYKKRSEARLAIIKNITGAQTAKEQQYQLIYNKFNNVLIEIKDSITKIDATNLNEVLVPILKKITESSKEKINGLNEAQKVNIQSIQNELEQYKNDITAVNNYYDKYLINIAKISNPNIINININNLQTPLVKNENLQQVLENLSNNWEKTKDSVLKYIKFTNDIAKAKLELATIKNNINTATSIEQLNNLQSQVSNYKLAEDFIFIVEAHRIEAAKLQTELSKQISEIKLDLTKATETQKTSVALAEFKALVQEKLNLLQSTTELKLEQVKTLKSEITKAKDTLLSNHPTAQTEADLQSFNELINLADPIISYGNAVISRREQIDEVIKLFLNSDPPRSSKDLEDKIKLPELILPKNIQSTLNLFENKQLSESLARGKNILNFYNKAQEIIQEITKENYKFNEGIILSELNNLYQKLPLEDQRTKSGSIKQEAQSIVDFYDIAEEYIAYTKQADINEQSINAWDKKFVESKPIVVAVPVTPGIDQVLKIAASAKKTALEYVKLKSKLEQNIKELQPDSNYAYSRINSEDYTKQESIDYLSEAQKSNIEKLYNNRSEARLAIIENITGAQTAKEQQYQLIYNKFNNLLIEIKNSITKIDVTNLNEVLVPILKKITEASKEKINGLNEAQKVNIQSIQNELEQYKQESQKIITFYNTIKTKVEACKNQDLTIPAILNLGKDVTQPTADKNHQGIIDNINSLWQEAKTTALNDRFNNLVRDIESKITALGESDNQNLTLFESNINNGMRELESNEFIKTEAQQTKYNELENNIKNAKKAAQTKREDSQKNDAKSKAETDFNNIKINLSTDVGGWIAAVNNKLGTNPYDINEINKSYHDKIIELASTKLAKHVTGWLFENRLDQANLALRDIESVISTKDIKQYFLENHFSEIKDKEIQNSKVDGLINESKIDEYKNTITSNQKFKDELVIQFREIKQNKLTNMQKYLAYVDAVKLHNKEIEAAKQYIETISASDITAIEPAPTLTSLVENNPIVKLVASARENAQAIVDFYDIAEKYIAYTNQADINEQSINAWDEYFVASKPIVVAVPVTPVIDQILKIAASAKKTALEYVKLKSKLEQNIKELQSDSNEAYSRINSEDYTKKESIDYFSEAQKSNIEKLYNNRDAARVAIIEKIKIAQIAKEAQCHVKNFITFINENIKQLKKVVSFSAFQAIITSKEEAESNFDDLQLNLNNKLQKQVDSALDRFNKNFIKNINRLINLKVKEIQKSSVTLEQIDFITTEVENLAALTSKFDLTIYDKFYTIRNELAANLRFKEHGFEKESNIDERINKINKSITNSEDIENEKEKIIYKDLLNKAKQQATNLLADAFVKSIDDNTKKLEKAKVFHDIQIIITNKEDAESAFEDLQLNLNNKSQTQVNSALERFNKNLIKNINRLINLKVKEIQKSSVTLEQIDFITTEVENLAALTSKIDLTIYDKFYKIRNELAANLKFKRLGLANEEDIDERINKINKSIINSEDIENEKEKIIYKDLLNKAKQQAENLLSFEYAIDDLEQALPLSIEDISDLKQAAKNAMEDVLDDITVRKDKRSARKKMEQRILKASNDANDRLNPTAIPEEKPKPEVVSDQKEVYKVLLEMANASALALKSVVDKLNIVSEKFDKINVHVVETHKKEDIIEPPEIKPGVVPKPTRKR